MAADFEASERFRHTTIRYLRHCLGLTCESFEPLPQQPVIQSFKDIGEDMVKKCPLGKYRFKRQLFMSELEYFVDMEREEQAATFSPRLSTSEEYRRRRDGTSATRLLLILTDYAYGFELPEKYYPTNNPHMQAIWFAANVITSTNNDILSLKKEIGAGQVEILVPLLYVENGFSLQRATDEAI
ncbi:MAG: hypothetical protein M1820_007565 [Bogoriella megaspora]|nr:MAG: hypothetical protein M1820_007565 [Bogoriella megaspora]